MEERVQKILASAGYGSRRSCELLITAGRVRVNGELVVLGSKADQSRDTIQVDNSVLPKSKPQEIYIALNKPRGVLSDNDPEGDRTTVLDLVPVGGHLFSVGRLDYDSEGLILLTNDGELANKLTHPRFGHEKEYRVLVATRPDEKQLNAWRRGVVLEDGHRTAPTQVEVENNVGDRAWLRIILREGRKRQLRETGDRIGLPVSRIIRVRIANVLLGNLKPREWRYLKQTEIEELKKSVSSRSPMQRRPRTMEHRVPRSTDQKKKVA
jgi:23S rRNA pseudouridine2605 synthase